MFERFGEDARRALFFSRYEAGRLGSREIDSEHILLGLLRLESQLLKRLFEEVHLNPRSLRREIEGGRPQIAEVPVSASAELPLTEHAKMTLAYTSHEAQTLNHQTIEPEHLLLGILRREESAAAQLLAKHGLNSENVREIVQRLTLEPGCGRGLRPVDARIVFTEDQCEFLDRLAMAARSHFGPTTREVVVRAIIEAVRSSHDFEGVGSIGELVRRIKSGPDRK